MSRVAADVQPTLQQTQQAGAADRCVTDPSLQALAPNCRQLNYELCPSIRAILARLRTIQAHPLAVVRFPRTQLSSLERSTGRLRASLRHATTPGQPYSAL